MANDDIQGTITDEAGNPIQGATVALIPDEGDSGDSVVYTTTDANGNYVFSVHPQGDATTQEWHVVAQYEDGGGSYNTLSKPNVSAAVREGIPAPDGAADSFDGYTVGTTGSFEKYTQTESGATPYITDTQAIDGSQSLTFDTAISSGDFFDWTFSSSKQPTDGRVYLRDNSGGGAGFSLVGPNGPLFNLMGDSYQIRVVHGNGKEINQSVQDDWVEFSVSNIDWTAETFDITVTNTATSSQLGSFSDLAFANSASSFDTWRFGCQQVSYSGGSIGGNGAGRDTFWFDGIDFRE